MEKQSTGSQVNGPFLFVLSHFPFFISLFLLPPTPYSIMSQWKRNYPAKRKNREESDGEEEEERGNWSEESFSDLEGDSSDSGGDGEGSDMEYMNKRQKYQKVDSQKKEEGMREEKGEEEEEEEGEENEEDYIYYQVLKRKKGSMGALLKITDELLEENIMILRAARFALKEIMKDPQASASALGSVVKRAQSFIHGAQVRQAVILDKVPSSTPSPGSFIVPSTPAPSPVPYQAVNNSGGRGKMSAEDRRQLEINEALRKKREEALAKHVVPSTPAPAPTPSTSE